MFLPLAFYNICFMTRKQIFDLQTLFLFYFLEYKIISMEKNIHKRFLECCKNVNLFENVTQNFFLDQCDWAHEITLSKIAKI